MFKNAIIAFIDLLGFGAQVSAINDADSFADAIKKVEAVQRLFEAIPSESAHDANTAVDRTVLAFSDSIVTALSVETDYYKRMGYEGALMELSYLGYSQFQCIAAQIFVRGGVAHGLWFHQDNIIVSPPMVTAVKLEQSTCVPVIAVSDDMYNLLIQANENETKRIIAKAELKFPLMEKDKSKIIYFIDYLRLAYEAEGASDRVIEIHRNSIQEAAAKVRGEIKVFNKYLWLAEYHNAFVEELGLDARFKVNLQ